MLRFEVSERARLETLRSKFVAIVKRLSCTALLTSDLSVTDNHADLTLAETRHLRIYALLRLRWYFQVSIVLVMSGIVVRCQVHDLLHRLIYLHICLLVEFFMLIFADAVQVIAHLAVEERRLLQEGPVF